MKLYREEDIDKLLHAIADVIEHRDLSKMPKAPKPIEITEEKLREYLWNNQPYIGGPDDLVRIFMEALSKLKGE